MSSSQKRGRGREREIAGGGGVALQRGRARVADPLYFRLVVVKQIEFDSMRCDAMLMRGEAASIFGGG